MEHVSSAVADGKGRDEPFRHRDHNRLVKVAEADLNPWAKIVRDGTAKAIAWATPALEAANAFQIDAVQRFR